MVELGVLLLAGCVDLGYGPTGMSVSSHKPLLGIADPKEQASAPARARLTVELPYEIVGDRRRNKSLKLAGFASDLADRSCLVALCLAILHGES